MRHTRFFSRARFFLRFLCWGTLFTAYTYTSGNGLTQLGAPVKDFCLPNFGESGYKNWDLMGSEGVYLDADSIAVKDMQLRTFSGEQELQLEVILRSPSAIIHMAHSTAESEESIHIEGPGYSGTGVLWSWNGKTHTLFLKSKVRVVFNNTILKSKEDA